MLRKKPSLILYFVCVHKDTARYVLSYSKPFGLLPKDLALIGVVALQSRATSYPSTDYSNCKYCIFKQFTIISD